MDELDSDSDSDMYIDEEAQLNDLEQLKAALEDDEPSTFSMGPSTSASVDTSQQPWSFPSTSSIEVAQEHARIDSALGLNKLLDEKLKRLEKVLAGRLNECRQRLSDLQTMPKTDKQERPEVFRYVNCGKPYFKDKSNFPAPDNEDTILMAKSNMFNFSEITSVPGWTVLDKTNFKHLLLKMSVEIKKRELTSKIAQLKREGDKKKPKQLEKEVDAVHREIMELSKKGLEELALPIDQEYDWEMVANKLNRRHSAAEFRALWKLFLHPSIRKTKWDKAEHTRLQEIAHKYNMQDWDAIAKELNTGRTGYQCFVYFRTNMSNSFTMHKWTKEEEEYLRRLIEYYKEDDYIPWGKVASAMENRTKIQIYNKYFRLTVKRKGRFLPEEDAVILTCLDKFGLNFKKIAEYLPGRSASQIRIRYGVLAKKRISTVWSIEEDKKLLQLMANEDSVTNYSSVTKYFPGKTRVNVRARYLTLEKWMRCHPNTSIEHAPRRGARRLGHGLASDNLNKATEKLRQRIETEIEHRNSKRITKDSPLEVIEDAIVANLLTEKAKEDERRRNESYNEDETLILSDNSVVSKHCLNVTNIHKLLIFLKARLKRDLFKKSHYAEQYAGLLDAQKQVNLFQVKSYSKKSVTHPIKLEETPDIWGRSTLATITHVLPPHYANITGCRRLMTYVNAKVIKDPTFSAFNINALMKRNALFKAQLFLLIERFNTLFLYPMLLSNEGPERAGRLVPRKGQVIYTPTSQETYEYEKSFTAPGALIPSDEAQVKTKKRKVLIGTPSRDCSIDLAQSELNQKDNTCLQKVVLDNNVFRFVTEKKKK